MSCVPHEVHAVHSHCNKALAQLDIEDVPKRVVYIDWLGCKLAMKVCIVQEEARLRADSYIKRRAMECSARREDRADILVMKPSWF